MLCRRKWNSRIKEIRQIHKKQINHHLYLYLWLWSFVWWKRKLAEAVPYDIGFRRTMIDKVHPFKWETPGTWTGEPSFMESQKPAATALNARSPDIGIMEYSRRISMLRTCHYHPTWILWYYMACDAAGIPYDIETTRKATNLPVKLVVTEPSSKCWTNPAVERGCRQSQSNRKRLWKPVIIYSNLWKWMVCWEGYWRG